jgi:vancomycin permeability regulator SanA
MKAVLTRVCEPAPGARRARVEFARGAALFIGCFALLGVLIRWRDAVTDLNLWWIDLRLFPDPLALAMEAAVGLALVAFGVMGRLPNLVRRPVQWVIWLFAAAAWCNACVIWRLAWHGEIQLRCWVPVSALVAGAFWWIGCAAGSAAGGGSSCRWRVLMAFAASALVFPILQVVGFGRTDYRRPADVAVVFGARVHADGRLSDALEDRVRMACEIYHQGLARQLVMSGGPGDGAIHETEAMRDAAIRLGVPADAIVLDRGGLNTRATLRTAARFAQERGWRRLIAVSEFYHLPRIKLAASAHGLEVVTVPSRLRHWGRALAVKNVLREVPAFWLYCWHTAAGRA